MNISKKSQPKSSKYYIHVRVNWDIINLDTGLLLIMRQENIEVNLSSFMRIQT